MRALASSLALFFGFFLTVTEGKLALPEAHAAKAGRQTVTCSGGPLNNSNVFRVIYVAATKTCTIDRTNASSNTKDNIVFRGTGGAGQGSVFIGTGTGASSTTHTGCKMGTTTKAAGADCSSIATPNGDFSGYARHTDSNGDTITMSWTATNSFATNMTITSASVDIPLPTAASSTTTRTPGTKVRGVVTSVTRSQTRGTVNNIQRHIDTISGNTVRPGIGQPQGGLQRGGVSGGAPGGAANPGTPGANDSGQTNFSGASPYSYAAQMTPGSNGLAFSQGVESLRDMAKIVVPRINFDTARNDALAAVFGATVLNQTGTDAPAQRIEDTSRQIQRGPQDVHAWIYGGYSNIDNTRNKTGDDQRFNGDTITLSAGLDKWVNDVALAGTALTFATTDLTTTFNSGDYKEDSYTVSPYGLWQANDWLTVNGSVGYTYSTISQAENKTTNLVSSGTRANAMFASVLAKASHQIDKAKLAGSVGYTRSFKRIAAFTDSSGTRSNSATSNSSTLNVGGEAGYEIITPDNTFEPYISADVFVDFQDTTNGDDRAADIGGGLKWHSRALDINAMLEATQMVGRDDYKQWNVQGAISKGFNSDELMGSLIPSLNFGANNGAMSTGASLLYAHQSNSFSLGLTAENQESRNTEDVRSVMGTLKLSF